ncbi:MAG: ribose 5-phosphate isomerase B [Desulfomonilaceae bacterium]
MTKMAIGCDHAGYDLKIILKEYLLGRQVDLIDLGCHSLTSCDYPKFAQDVCLSIFKGEASLGILVCGTGIGMSMSANRFKGIRAALCANEYHARMSRAHNNANVLCLGSRVIGSELALSILSVWLDTEFEGNRHLRRVNLMDEFSIG